jgi:hypothetical protein
MYAPIFKAARPVREHALGARHSAVLLTDVEPDPASRIRYAHLLVVFRSGQADPIAFISAEEAKVGNEELKEMGLDDLDFGPSEGSHFLCAFVEDGHQNFGASDDWGDLAKFERAALDLVNRLGLVSRI